MLGVYISMIKTLEENLEKVLKAIRSLIIEDMAKDMPMLALTLELLQSIPGIGLISAVTILAEIGDFSAFSKPGKLVAYFGIDPSVMQSGEFTGTQNKMSKRGSRLLRRVLFTIALANIRTKRDKTACNPVLMEYYKNKCQSKPKKVALGLLCVSLLIIFLLFLGIESLTNYVLPKSTRKCLQRSTQQLSSTCTRCLVFKINLLFQASYFMSTNLRWSCRCAFFRCQEF